jgi:hypothetical protein
MNKSFLTALAVATVAGLGGYGLSNYAGAQGAPPAQVSDGTQPADPPHSSGEHRSGDRGHSPWMMGGEQQHHWHKAHARDWGLFYAQVDKKLSVADVQTLAQAVLLRHGNHAWKVANVAQNQDDTVSFTFATQSGDVVARFTMDTHTGRLRRLG